MASSWTPRIQARAYARVHEATRSVRASTTQLRQLERATKDKTLRALGEALLRRADDIEDAREADLKDVSPSGVLPAQLAITRDRLEDLAHRLRMVAAAPDPIGEVLRSTRQRTGMQLRQTRVPIGVLGVLFDDPIMLLWSAAMLLKTGNAALLHHMGSPLPRTEAMFLSIIHEIWQTHGVPVNAVELLCDDHRATTRHLLNAHGQIDLILPLLDRPIPPQLRVEATVPIAEVAPGNCHIYVDAGADIPLAVKVVLDSKLPFTTAPSAVDQVLVHAAIADSFVPRLTMALAAHDIRLHANARIAQDVPASPEVEEDGWSSGHGALDIGCSVVDSTSDAIAHINRYGSGHTEAIVTTDPTVAERFLIGIDAAMVIVNAATTFQHLNANLIDPELAFSTHRLAPRGPLTLSELTTTKWLATPTNFEMAPSA